MKKRETLQLKENTENTKPAPNGQPPVTSFVLLAIDSLALKLA